MTLLWTLALLALLTAPALAQPDRFGLPSCSAPSQELARRSYFTLCHDADRKTATYVVYELTPDHLTRTAASPSHFRADADLSSRSARNADYTHSGFSRGHLAPAADFGWSESAIRATFVLSNAVPQYQSVNSGRWSQLESRVRRLAAGSDALIIFTGPIYDSPEPAVIGEGRVAVPTHLYKVVLAIRGSALTAVAAIVPNTPNVREPLEHFLTSVDEVERRTGLDFFADLPDDLESRIEAGSSTSEIF